jgi:carboxylesterase
VVNIPNPLDIRLSGGKIGILVIHGFTGTPESIAPWAEGFHDAGLSVIAPVLPGHGTKWEDLNATTWNDWYKTVEDTFLELKKNCERVFVAGFSVGGALALRLAQIRGSEIEGLLLCNAAIFDDRKFLRALPLIKNFIPSTKTGPMDVKKSISKRMSYDRMPLRALDSLRHLWRNVEENLYLIDLPLMVSYSIDDHVIHPINSEAIIDNVYSTDIREVIFEESFHNVAWDYDSDLLIEESIRFIHDVLSGEIQSGEQYDERDLIDAEFESIVSGLNLDQSTQTTYLDSIEESTHFSAPRPRNLVISQASRFSLAAIVASGLYILLEGFNGGDPLNLGGWPAILLFCGGVASFIWRTTKKHRDDEDDGAVL